jgi:hypothetical protein
LALQLRPLLHDRRVLPLHPAPLFGLVVVAVEALPAQAEADLPRRQA